MITYYTIWALMLKLKLKHTNLLDFVSSSLFCLENDKLSWNSYWHKNSSYKCIHISALQSRKLRLRESTRLILSSLLLLGFASLNVPPWLLSKTFLYTLRTFQSNRILTMSIFSPVILFDTQSDGKNFFSLASWLGNTENFPSRLPKTVLNFFFLFFFTFLNSYWTTSDLHLAPKDFYIKKLH